MTIHLQLPLQMPQNRITVAVTITHLVYMANAELNIQIRFKEPSIQGISEGQKFLILNTSSLLN